MVPPIKMPKTKTSKIIYNRYPNTNPTLWKENKKLIPHIDAATLKSAQLENKMLAVIQQSNGISCQELADQAGIHHDTAKRILAHYKKVGVVKTLSRRWYLSD